MVDTLIQAFEDRRLGLSSEQLAAGGPAVAGYFLEVYEQERPRIRAELDENEPHLTEAGRAAMFGEIDQLIREMIIPAYTRLSAAFTPKERRDFYHVPDGLHLLERLGWAFLGLLIGFFVLWARFIPLWTKELVLPLVIAGLVYPELRRFLALRRYERDLNQLVARADRELVRIDRAYLTRGEVIDELAELGSSENAGSTQAARRVRPGQSTKEH